jgi:hypothetical protein
MSTVTKEFDRWAPITDAELRQGKWLGDVVEVDSYTSHDDHITIVVFDESDYYSVRLYDDEAGEWFPLVFKFDNQADAINKARAIIAGQGDRGVSI